MSHVTVIDTSNSASFDANGRILSREEQAGIARMYGRHDVADEMLGIRRPWYLRIWRALRF